MSPPDKAPLYQVLGSWAHHAWQIDARRRSIGSCAARVPGEPGEGRGSRLPHSAHQHGCWSPASCRLPARDQKGRNVVRGVTIPGPMVGLGWEGRPLTGRLQEHVGKPQECQRRGGGRTAGMLEFKASVCHVCGAQNPGFE